MKDANIRFGWMRLMLPTRDARTDPSHFVRRRPVNVVLLFGGVTLDRSPRMTSITHMKSI